MVGDIGGAGACDDIAYDNAVLLFNSFESPLVYVPGDNEWTDCHDQGKDPIERLARLRQVVYPRPESMGKRPIPLEQQSAERPEHVRWLDRGVMFVGLNVAGSNNNHIQDLTGGDFEDPRGPAERQAAEAEYQARGPTLRADGAAPPLGGSGDRKRAPVDSGPQNAAGGVHDPVRRRGRARRPGRRGALARLDVPAGRLSPVEPTAPPVPLAPSRLAGVGASPGAAAGPVVRLSDLAARATPCVVLAADLAPADVVALDTGVVLALATAAGAPLSHAAILARSLGIPFVTGLGAALLDVAPGAVVLVDGDAGTVDLEPAAAQVTAAAARRDAAHSRLDEARRQAGAPAVTLDGRTVPVLVNVGSPQDAAGAVVEGADGVGMLRTEFAFLGRSDPPGEAEQYEAYRGVANALGDRPLVVRTLDLGSDIPAWGGGWEPNPALGNRGIRFTLANRPLLETQLRAIARLAAERPLQVMFPMVTTIDEVRLARACLEEAGTTAGLEVGITVEVPAAALTAGALAPLVDFFAVGTNDLTQYTLAADRANAAVAGLADGMHPAVLRLIREVTDAGGRLGRPVEVVGELGCDPLAVPLLLGLGVSALSVRPNAVATVKQAVRLVRHDDARRLAGAALDAESSAAVRRLCADAAAV